MRNDTIIIKPTDRTAVLTGAGISAESGIKTFREAGGLWETHPIEDVATPEGFARDPKCVWQFYNERRKDLKKAKPNPGHLALAEMEKLCGQNFFLVTQNVDDLHEKAGSRGVVHMHGELNKVRCLDCSAVYFDDTTLSDMPRCRECGGVLRPHIVWFGEMPFFMEKIHRKLYQCNWFIAVGTSGVVYPAAEFIQTAKRAGATTICINPDPSTNNRHVDHYLNNSAGVALPKLVELMTGT